MHPFEFVVLCLAAGALVNAWLMRDGLFAGWVDAIGIWGEPLHDTPTLGDKWRGFWSQLLTCRVCLTYHVAFWLYVLFYLPSLWLTPPWDVVLFTPIYTLAATRLSLLIGSAVTALDLKGDPEVDE